MGCEVGPRYLESTDENEGTLAYPFFYDSFQFSLLVICRCCYGKIVALWTQASEEGTLDLPS